MFAIKIAFVLVAATFIAPSVPAPDENCQNGNGADYAGMVTKTKSGLNCQKWTSKTPHTDKWHSLGDHNYCRNPDGHTSVWCYTTDPKTKWEDCAVPVCGTMCTGSYQEPASTSGNGKARPKPQTKCVEYAGRVCHKGEGIWGSSWCYVDDEGSNWGSECVRCSDCSCSDFMNYSLFNWYGQCKKGFPRFFGGLPFCYVNMPSNCIDRREGKTSGKWFSAQACNSQSGRWNLPAGWEERHDANGRIYYANHLTRTTQWGNPSQVEAGEREQESFFG